MQITDAVADMLTRIRNASFSKHKTVDIPASNMKKSIANILLEEGYVKGVKFIEDSKQGVIKVTLKYGADKNNAIKGIKRISKPGLRVYAGRHDLPRVLGGLGVALISTPAGVMTDKKARTQGIGGEVLAFVW